MNNTIIIMILNVVLFFILIIYLAVELEKITKKLDKIEKR